MPRGGRAPVADTRLRRLAAALGGGEEVAFLIDDERVCWARPSAVTDVAGAGPPSTSSAVLALLLGVHEGFPGRAHLLARRRIWTTSAPRRCDRELVRVGGSKLTTGVEPAPFGGPGEEDVGEPLPTELVDVAVFAGKAVRRAQASARAATDALEGLASSRPSGPFDGPGAPALERAVGAVRALAATPALPAGPAAEHAVDEVPLPKRDRAVAAVVLDGHGTTIGAARNVNGRNRMLHAEMSAVLAGLVRPGCTVVVSLKPCRMCAALLDEVAGRSLRVIYLDDDPGRLAQGTVLDGGGRLTRWASPSAGQTGWVGGPPGAM